MNDSHASPQHGSNHPAKSSDYSNVAESARSGARADSASGAPYAPTASASSPEAQVERRKKRRALISAPVRVRAPDLTPDGPDEISTTVDVSRNGILFLTSSQAFHRGTEVSVTFPYAHSPVMPQSEQPGTVVRVTALSNNQTAVAIAFGFASGEHSANISAAPLDTAVVPNPDDSSNAEETDRPLILAVESDGPARDSLKAYLSGEGYKVIAVDNAADAREVLHMLTPALLIAEIEGEGLPGFDLCAHVKGTPRLQHIPVVLTTGSAYPSDYSNAHSLGAVVCMAKPYRQERLGHVVRLLVAPLGASAANAAPPRKPDTTRRPKANLSRSGSLGRLYFR